MRSVSATADEAVSLDTNCQVIWQDEDTVISDGSGSIPIAFVIPDDAPGTSTPDQKCWHFWQLKVEACGAESYHAEFDMPVYRVTPTPAEARDAKTIAALRDSKREDYTPSSAFRVRIGPALEGGTEVIFPPMRSAAHAVAVSVIFLMSLALFIFVFAQMTLRLSAIWGVVNVLLFAWLLRIWFATERVVIGNGTVSFTSGLFRVRQTMPLCQVTGIHIVAGPVTGRNAIRIRGAGWRRFDVGDGIADQRDAEWVARQMSLAAGIQPAAAGRGYQPAEDMEIINEFVKDFEGGKIDFGLLGNALVDAFKGRKKTK
jgi:hypothetical protein